MIRSWMATGQRMPHAGMDNEAVTALSGGILYSAHLLDAFLFGSDLSVANLSSVKVRQSDFSDSTMVGTKLWGFSCFGLYTGHGYDLGGAFQCEFVRGESRGSHAERNYHVVGQVVLI